MRIVALIGGFVVSAIYGFQSLALGGLSSIATSLDATNAEAVSASQAAGTAGVSVFFGVIAAIVVYGLPTVAAVLFGLAGVVSLQIGDVFPDAMVWGWVYILLAVAAVAGRREKRLKREREEKLLKAAEKIAASKDE